jgi:hypothetical protein
MYGQAELEKRETVDPNEQYVYSDNLKVPGSKNTFAKESLKYKDDDKADDITKRTNKLMLDRLRENQEVLKLAEAEKQMKKEMKKGGKMEYLHGGYLPSGDARDTTTVYGSIARYGASPKYGGSNFYMQDGGYMGFHNYQSPGPQAVPNLDNYFTNPQFDTSVPETGNFQPNVSGPTSTPQGNMPVSNNNFDWQQAAMMAGQFAPIAQNFARGMQGVEDPGPIYNPQYDKAIELASGRRYNADPEIEAAERTFQEMEGAVNQYAGGNANLALANLHGAQLAADRAKSQVLSRQQNMDNQYQLQEAQLRANLGAQRAQAERQAEADFQAASAASRGFTNMGFQQLGQFSQASQQAANQRANDKLLEEGLRNLGLFG